MKKKKLLLTAIAVALIFTASISGACAYFTTYAETKGDKVVEFGYESDIEEDFDNLIKKVVITNKEKSEPICVRVQAMCIKDLAFSGAGWVNGGDGYWYYGKSKNNCTPLYGGDSTTEIDISLAEDLPEDIIIGDPPNIVVFYETTPLFFEKGDDGEMHPAVDWNMILDTNKVKGGDK